MYGMLVSSTSAWARVHQSARVTDGWAPNTNTATTRPPACWLTDDVLLVDGREEGGPPGARVKLRVRTTS